MDDSDIDDDIFNEILNDDNDIKVKKKQANLLVPKEENNEIKPANNVEENKNESAPRAKLMQDIFLDEKYEFKLNSPIKPELSKQASVTPTNNTIVGDSTKSINENSINKEPVKNKMNLDDDILSSMDRSPANSRHKNKSSIMDDLFGKNGKESQSNFMDGILNGNSGVQNKDKNGTESDFVLDPKYAKSNHDDKSSVFSGNFLKLKFY